MLLLNSCRRRDDLLASCGCQRSFLRACLLLVSLPLLVAAGSSASDAAALQQFAVQTNLTTWLLPVGVPCNSTDQATNFVGPWPGVTCNSQQRVTKVQLSNYGNTGEFPAYLDQLDALEALQLSNGLLVGTLPSAWSLAFPFLQQLDLSNNNMTGGIPDSWTAAGSFSNLTVLNLSAAFNKNTTRELPFSAGQLGMANLSTLKLASCNITGSLTVAWGSGFKQLSTLVLSNNELTGTLPSGWGTSPGTGKLTELALDGNLFTGSLLPSWGSSGSFAQLQRLDLASNKLTATLPTQWGAAGSLPKLAFLLLNDNSFTGSLPASWASPGALPQLENLFLQGNSLQGGIPLAWANLRPNMLKYLKPGNPKMCEPVRARLSGVRVFGTANPVLSCLDAACNEDGDIATALDLGQDQACTVTVSADGIFTSAGCSSGVVQRNASVNGLNGQYVIANQPPLTLTSSSFRLLRSVLVAGPNKAQVNQSAPLIISNSTVHIVNSTFSDNEQFDFGGMIVMSGGAVTISNTVFTGLVGRVGGAMMIMNGSLVMMDQATRFSSNAGTCLAGAVLVNFDSALYMDSVSFSGNQANGDRGGGAILLSANSSVYVSGSHFESNAATAANLYPVAANATAASDETMLTSWCGAVGGVPGIDVLYGINDLASSILLGSPSGTTPDPTLGQGGGAIYAVSFNVLSIKGSNFTGNTASRVNITDFKLGRGAGGAISINSDAVSLSSCGAGRVTISACHFTDNHANSGGAIQAVGSGHLAQTFNSRSNSRTSYGRYNVSYLASLPFNSYTFAAQTMAYCTVSDSVFEGNSALLGGGALSVLQGYSVQLTNLSFTDNTTPLYGGAIAVANGSGLFTESCTFKACTAAQGGAIYAVAPSEAYIQFNVIPLWRNFNIYPSDVYKLGRQMGSAVSLSNNVFVDSSATTAGAAVYMSGDSQLVSQENTFTGGQAGTQGGALFLNNVCQQLSLSDTFLGNSAQQGGAVAILNPALTSGRYILSVSVTAAGPTSIFRLPCGVSSALADATFADNRAAVSGGAVYAVSTPAAECRVLLESSTLRHNTAINGGAFFGASTPCFMVNTTSFTGNVGTNGGAMAMQSVTNVTLTGITAVGNTAHYGGAMLIDRAALVQVMQSNLSGNKATNGAGISVQQVAFMNLYNVSIMNNSARELGGGLYSIQPSISIEDRTALNAANNVFTIGDLYLDSVNMALNSASQGGCMYVTGNGANVTAKNSFFDSCDASEMGGGLMCEKCNQVYMNQVHFTSNHARDSAGGFRCQECFAVILERMQFFNNSAIHGGGLDINATLPKPVIITASQFTSNSAQVVDKEAGNSSVRATLAGNGGAIRCLGGNLFMEDDSFEDNEATNGAAVYAVQGCGQVDNLISSGYCFLADTPAATATTAVAAVNMDPAALSIATAAAVHYGNILGHTPDCSAITLSQTEFYANKAIGGGGGAIFWDGPVEDLIVICSDIFDADVASNDSTTPSSCADWEGNNSTLGFGGDLASEAAAINASESQLDPITSFPSGGILPSLRFSVLDHFGNLVSGGLSAASMLVSATSTNAILGGQQLAQAADGLVTFDGLIITANSSMNTTGASGLNYTITFSAASLSGITSWDVPINIRGCEPGEQYDANVCRKCQEQTYSFHPGDDGGQCQTCPDVAHCPGGPIFVPDDHYWHSSFDSDSAQRCPNTFACSLSADTTNLDSPTSNTARSQLLEGCQTAWYNGTTTGNPVLDEEGNIADIVCQTPAGSVAYSDAQCHEGYNGLLCSDCDDGWGNSRTFHCNKCMSKVAINTFLIFLGYLASFCYVAWLVRGSLASAAQVGTAGAGHFEQFSDMMKVLTTNLQTNGIIAGLNINWPNSLRSIQNVFNVVQSSMVNTVSMDCSLQYWDSQIMSQAQIEAVIAMLIPIGMLGVFIIMWTCRWAYVRKYGQLTDITGQPISRASSASSAQAFQQRPRAVDRSLTCDSDLSGSSSGSEGEGEGEDMIPAGQFQDGPASRKKTGGSALGQHSAKPQSSVRKDSNKPKKRASWGSLSMSRSKGKATQDGQQEAFVSNGQARSEDGSPRATLEDEDPDQYVEGLQTSAYVPPVQTPDEKEWQQVGKQSPLQRQLAAAGQDGLQSESSDDFGGAHSVGSIDSNSPLLARLMQSTSLARGQLVEELGSSLTAAALAAHTDQMAGVEQGTGFSALADAIQVAPSLEEIRTSSSHALFPPVSDAEEAVQKRKHNPGSTRFALDASKMGSGKVSSTKSRLGQSALKRSNTSSPAGRSKSLRRVLVTAPNDDDEDVSTAQVSLEIQQAAAREADDQAWPQTERPSKANRLVPTKSSLKSPASGKKKLGVSGTRFSSLRFHPEPQHHAIAVTPQDSMGSDHSTLSASFKSFRSIPSRLSQFGSQHSLRWTLAADQSVEFWSYCKRRFITTAVVLAYFMYPDMSENIANIFSCYPIQFGTYSNGYTSSRTAYYWTQDPTQVCFSGNHFWTALLLGAPGVFIVCLGIPTWFAGVLYRSRHDLDNLSLRRTYGFLYQGYKQQYYWWESSLLLRNLVLVAVVYLGPALGVYIQAHVVFLIMVVSLLLHAYTRPFKEPIIDNMEFVSIGSITLVMYISLYFLEVEQGLSTRTQWVLGFILLALICGTCLWFLFNIFRRKEVLVALFKSTTVKAGRGFAQIRTLVKSDRLRSMITRSTDRSTSNATLRSNTTMQSTTEAG